MRTETYSQFEYRGTIPADRLNDLDREITELDELMTDLIAELQHASELTCPAGNELKRS